jgi:hypothetical protein
MKYHASYMIIQSSGGAGVIVDSTGVIVDEFSSFHDTDSIDKMLAAVRL